MKSHIDLALIILCAIGAFVMFSIGAKATKPLWFVVGIVYLAIWFLAACLRATP